MDIVLKLRELRRMRRLSQKEAALSSGIGEKTLSSFETGDRIASMKLSQLFALLSAYDITAAEFFGDRVESDVFAELERLTSEEAKLIAALRRLPEQACSRLSERFLEMTEAADLALRPALRAIV